jgi:hypothetical protein
VQAQDVRDPRGSRQAVTDRPGRQHEVRVHDVVRLAAHEPPARQQPTEDEGEHRGQGRHGGVPPQRHRDPYHPHATRLDGLARQPERAGRQDRHRVPLRQRGGEMSGDHPAAAAERRVLVVAEENAHG